MQLTLKKNFLDDNVELKTYDNTIQDCDKIVEEEVEEVEKEEVIFDKSLFVQELDKE